MAATMENWSNRDSAAWHAGPETALTQAAVAPNKPNFATFCFYLRCCFERVNVAFAAETASEKQTQSKPISPAVRAAVNTR